MKKTPKKCNLYEFIDKFLVVRNITENTFAQHSALSNADPPGTAVIILSNTPPIKLIALFFSSRSEMTQCSQGIQTIQLYQVHPKSAGFVLYTYKVTPVKHEHE
jgi:hypothetical protein